MNNVRVIGIVSALALLTAACGGGRPAEIPEDARNSGGGVSGDFQNSRITDLLGPSGSSSDTGGGLTPVNRFLWRASLDTLAFLPLNSTLQGPPKADARLADVSDGNESPAESSDEDDSSSSGSSSDSSSSSSSDSEDEIEVVQKKKADTKPKRPIGTNYAYK